MSNHDPSDDSTNRHSKQSRDVDPTTTRRGLLKLSSASLLGTGLLGGVSSVARAAPAPGAVNWSGYIENPRLYAENAEPPHVPTTMPYGSLSVAREAERRREFLSEQWLDSAYVQSLNGAWQFHFADDLSGAATDASDYESWDTVAVPHTWDTDGYGALEYYNVSVGFGPNDPPNVPSADNSVGTYKREFTVPEGWTSDRQTFLRIGAAKAGYFVWVNGAYVGYKQGSMTPGEFDVTGVVEEGAANTATIQVIRWTDGTYIEEQDMFRYAGIFRDVHLYSKPDLCVRDFFAATDLDETYTDGFLDLSATVANYDTGQRDATLRARLFDPGGDEVATADATVSLEAGTTGDVSVQMDVPDVDAWHAEDPTLYALGLELVPGGQSSASEAVIDKIGFRSYEILPGSDGSGDVFAVNGEPVTLTGTNKHAHSHLHGRHVSRETMLEDVRLLKQSNHNAVRLSHYPNHVDFYRLADEYGLYVQDEVNAEAHANQDLSDDPSYVGQFVDRFRRMLDRDKNFASINIWSTGNEAGLGRAHYRMSEYATATDPTRMLYHQDNNGGTAPYADIVGPRYISPSDYEGRAGDGDARPVVMGEYAHAMGNSGGLPHDFYEVAPRYDTLQGGYIWDWVNQSNWLTTDYAEDEPDALLIEDHRTAAVEDRSIAGNLSTVHGVPAVGSGPTGPTLDLAERGDWVEVANDDSLDLTEEFTVEAAVKLPADFSDAPDFPFVAKGDSQYALGLSSGRTVEFAVSDGTDRHAVSGGVPAKSEASWRRITGVYDGDALRLYVDGKERDESTFSGQVRSNHEPVALGDNADPTADGVPIEFDSVRIDDRALSADEVAADRARPGDSTRLWLDFELVERYRFWDTDSPDEWFALNGYVYGDRETMPEFEQVKKAHQRVAFEPADLANGRIDVANRYDFTDLDAFDVAWELKADDTVLQSGTLDLSLSPGAAETVDVGFEKPMLRPGTDYFLNLSATLAREESWAPAGHEVAFEQFEVPWDVPVGPTPRLADTPDVSYSIGGTDVTITGEDFTYVFDASAARFSSLRRHGEQLLARGPEMNAWREPTLNERSSWRYAEAMDWYVAGLHELEQTALGFAVAQPDSSAVRVVAETENSAPDRTDAFVTEYVYHVLGSGDIVTRVRITPNADMRATVTQYLPKYGLQMRLADQFDRFEWYGRGPRETYPDKKWGQRIGRYAGSVDDQFVEYLPPQDYGNKCDARYAAVTNDDGVGLLAFGQSGTPTMNTSVQAFADMAGVEFNFPIVNSDIQDAGGTEFNHQLEYADGVVFNVDYDVSGVGGTPVNTREEYRVNPERVEFVYGLRPFDGSSEDPLALSRRELPYSDSAVPDVDTV